MNDAPVAADASATTAEDTAIVIDVATLIADIDGDAVTVTASVPASEGEVSVVGTVITFTPAANYNGPATISYTVSDGALSDTAEIVVNVTPVNDAPTTSPDTFAILEDTTLVINPTSLLFNDSDIDGDDLSVLLTTTGPNAITVNNGATVSLVGG